jgi:hypothetical protein
MRRVGGPGKASPTTSALQRKSITPIELVVGQWHFGFVVDAEPATGALRDLATTVAARGVPRSVRQVSGGWSRAIRP